MSLKSLCASILSGNGNVTFYNLSQFLVLEICITFVFCLCIKTSSKIVLILVVKIVLILVVIIVLILVVKIVLKPGLRLLKLDSV